MEETLTKSQIIRGLNLWMDAYIEDPAGFEAEFRTVGKHLAEMDAGEEPSYGAVGFGFIAKLLSEPQDA